MKQNKILSMIVTKALAKTIYNSIKNLRKDPHPLVKVTLFLSKKGSKMWQSKLLTIQMEVYSMLRIATGKK